MTCKPCAHLAAQPCAKAIRIPLDAANEQVRAPGRGNTNGFVHDMMQGQQMQGTRSEYHCHSGIAYRPRSACIRNSNRRGAISFMEPLIELGQHCGRRIYSDIAQRIRTKRVSDLPGPSADFENNVRGLERRDVQELERDRAARSLRQPGASIE
jgi:hypothetical protein